MIFIYLPQHFLEFGNKMDKSKDHFLLGQRVYCHPASRTGGAYEVQRHFQADAKLYEA